MPEDNVSLGLDVTQFVGSLQKAVDALKALYQTEDAIVRINKTFNETSTQLMQTLTVTGDAGNKAAIKLTVIDGILKSIGTSASGSAEHMKLVEQVLNILYQEAGKATLATNQFAEAQRFAAGITNTEMKAALEADIARLQRVAENAIMAAEAKKLAAQNVTANKIQGIQEQLTQPTPIMAAAPKSFKDAYAENAKVIADFAVQHKISWERIEKEEARIIANGPKNYNAAKQQVAAQLQTLLQQRINIAQQAATAEGGYQDQFLIKMQENIDKQNRLQKEASRIRKTMVDDEAAHNKAVEAERIRKIEEDIARQKSLEQARINNAKSLGRELIGYSDQQIANAKVREADAEKQRRALAQTMKLENQADALQAARMRAAQTYSSIQQQINNGMLRNVKTSTDWDAVSQRHVTTMRGFNNVGKEVTATIYRQNGVLENARISVDALGNSAQRFGLTWESILRMFAMQTAYQLFYGMVGAIQQSVQAAQDLQIKIAQIQTISESGFNISNWSKGIMDVSNATGLLAKDVAEGVYDTLSNQIADGSKALEFMSVAGKFAITTNSTLKESVNAISSAMNSYGTGVEDATHISDVYFRMIDKGRITTGQFANEIGRIFPAAEQLGVKIEEVAAVLSTLTRAGVTPAQAMTSLFNVFSRLLKPAGEMSTFLKGIGVSSGQAAIQTYGFAQMLGKIATFAEGKPEVIAQLFPDIRGLRAMLRLAGEGINEFKSDLDAMYNSAGAMNKAFEYFNNNPGKQFQIEMNKITNMFTANWGTTIVERIAYMNKEWINLTGTVRLFADALLWIGGPAALAGIAKLILGTKALEAGFGALILANKRLALIFGVGGAVALGMIALAEYLDDITAKLEKLEKDYDDAYKTMIDSNKKFVDETTKNTREGLNKQSQSVLQNFAHIRTEIDEHNSKLKEQYKETLNSFKDIHDAFVDSIKKSLDELKKARDDSKKEAEDAAKFLKEAPVKLQEQQIQIRISQAETPQEKLKVYTDEFNRLNNLRRSSKTTEEVAYNTQRVLDILTEIDKVEKSITKENEKALKSQEKNAKELILVDKQIADNEKRQALQKIKDEKDVAAIKKKGKYVQVGDELKPINKAQESTLEKDKYAGDKLKQQHDELLRKKNELLQKSKEINIVNHSGINAIELQNKAMADSIAKVEIFKADSEAAEKAQQDKIDITESALKTIEKAFADIEKFKFGDIFKIDTNVSTDKAVDKAQKAIATMIQTQYDNITKYEEALINMYGKDSVEGKKVAETINKIKKELAEAHKATEKRINVEIADHRYKTLKETQDKLVADYSESLSDLKSKTTVPMLNLMSEPLITTSFKLYPESFTKVQQELKNELIELFTHPEKILDFDEAALSIKRKVNILVGMGKPGGTWETEMRKSGNLIEGQVKTLLGQFKALDAKKAEMTDIDKKMLEQYKQIQTAFGKDGFVIEATNNNTDKTASNTEALNRAIDAINAMSAIELWKITGQVSEVEGFAKGGYARGTDTIPAMLSPGEFVVNANATRRFYSQLVSMNSGQHFARGGLVTNVGDINVNLTPTGNTKVDVVSIGNELQREIRRGRIRLG